MADLHNNPGPLRGKHGHPLDAADCFREAPRLRPDFTKAADNLAADNLATDNLADEVASARDTRLPVQLPIPWPTT